MHEARGGKLSGQGMPSIAIYNTPRIVGERLTAELARAGFDVLFEGNLKPETALNQADIWVVKWAYHLNYDFLKSHHPRLGFVSATKGADHIDRKAMAEFNLRADYCPTFSTIPVAEHAMALAMRSAYGPCCLPPLKSGIVVFSEFSDDYAERAVAQILMRTRGIERMMERARSVHYLDADLRRPGESWANEELTGAKIGIIGRERGALKLASILKDGFNCDLHGHDIPEELEGYYGVKSDSLLNILEHSDYIFLCTSSYGPRAGPWSFDSRSLPEAQDMRFGGSDVTVIGTGAIGSTIARMCKKGFDCRVRAFNRSMKPELAGIVEYLEPQKPVSEAISLSNFSFISLPLNAGTSNLITAEQMASLTIGRMRVLINVARDKIIDSHAILDFLSNGAFSAYATDLVHNDAMLCDCEGKEPESLARVDAFTRGFLDHTALLPTPHEAEASRNALDRLVREVLAKLNNFMM